MGAQVVFTLACDPGADRSNASVFACPKNDFARLSVKSNDIFLPLKRGSLVVSPPDKGANTTVTHHFDSVDSLSKSIAVKPGSRLELVVDQSSKAAVTIELCF